ncbi:MAG: hypothetical protein ACK5MT_05285 [Actinomycetales bacterium]
MPMSKLKSHTLRDRLEAFVAGRPVTTSGSLRDRLMTAFGHSSRDPNLTAASAQLGISTGQLRRWVTGQVRRPNPDKIKDLTKPPATPSTPKPDELAWPNADHPQEPAPHHHRLPTTSNKPGSAAATPAPSTGSTNHWAQNYAAGGWELKTITDFQWE